MSVTLNFKPCDNTGEIYNLLKIGVGNESLDFFLKKKKTLFERQARGNMQFSLLWVTFQMPTTAKAGAGCKQEPGIPSAVWAVRSSVLDPSSATSQTR